MPSDEDANSHFSTRNIRQGLKNRTISSGIVTIGSQAIQFTANICAIMVLARLLAPEDFGLIAMAMTVLGILGVLKDAGLSTATIQKENITHPQVSNLFWVNTILSVLIGIITVILSPLVALFYGDVRIQGIVLALSVTFIFHGLTVQHHALFSRQMRFGTLAIIDIGSLFSGLLSGILMALAGFGYWSLVALNLVPSFVCLILTWNISSWRPQRPKRNADTRPLLKFGTNVTTSHFLTTITNTLDKILIGKFLGAESTGLYARAEGLALRPMRQALFPITSVFLPALSRLQNDTERYQRAFLSAFEIIILSSYFFTGIFFSLAEPLTISLLGEQWTNAVPILRVFIVMAIFFAMNVVTYWIFTSQGRSADLLKSNIIGTVITIIAFSLGIRYGAIGVAIAYTFTSLFLTLPITFYIAGRSGPIKAIQLFKKPLKHIPILIFTYLITYHTQKLTSEFQPAAQLLIGVTLGGISAFIFSCIYPPSRAVLHNTYSKFKSIHLKTDAYRQTS